jgi:hypothetical protein
MRGDNRNKTTTKRCLQSLGAGSFFFASVAHATPQLRCPEGMSPRSPPEFVVVLASLLLAAAPLAAGMTLAAHVLKRGRQSDAPKRSVGRTYSLVAGGVVFVGIAGSVITSLFALLLLVSGAWVRCG